MKLKRSTARLFIWIGGLVTLCLLYLLVAVPRNGTIPIESRPHEQNETVLPPLSSPPVQSTSETKKTNHVGFELAVVLGGAVVGLFGVIKGISTWLHRKDKVTITLQLGDRRYEIDTTEISSEDIEKLLLKVTETSEAKPTSGSKEAGVVSVEALILIIPGLIALMLAGTFIYLLIVNQATPDYSVPKELGAAMTTIIGYYFGLGASSIANKGKTLSPEEVRALIKSNG